MKLKWWGDCFSAQFAFLKGFTWVVHIYWGIFKVSYLGCDYNFPVLSSYETAFCFLDYLKDRGFGLLLYITIICLQIRLGDLWGVWLLEACMCLVGVLGQVKWNNFQKKKGLGSCETLQDSWKRRRWADQLPMDSKPGWTTVWTGLCAFCSTGQAGFSSGLWSPDLAQASRK